MPIPPPPAESDSVRVDRGVRQGDEITFHYDPMIAKVIAHGGDRDSAIGHMAGALEAFRIEGVSTNIAFLRKVMAHDDFRAGRIDTGFVEANKAGLI